jgi:hypothetical protein
VSGFRKFVNKAEGDQAPENDPTRCSAYGCKVRASVSQSGSGWACFAHAFAHADQWQSVTRGLNDHEWLLGLVNDVRKMAAENKDWRGYALKFWDGSDNYCKPQPFENDVPYQNRMLLELLHRIGQNPKRPAPRNPAAVKPAGRFAQSAVAA